MDFQRFSGGIPMAFLSIFFQFEFFLDPRVWLDQRKKNTVVHYTKASQLDRRSKKPPQFKSQPAAIALNPLNIETTEPNIESQ